MYPKAVWPLVSAGVIAFVLLSAAAMVWYPGGTIWRPDREGYSFWTNSFSDLGRQVTYDGQLNTASSWAFRAGLSTLVAAIGLFWLRTPDLLPRWKRLVRWVRLLGLLSVGGMLATALTPADTQEFAHMAAIGLASVPGLLGAVLLTGGSLLDPAAPRWLGIGALTVLASAGVHFSQYVHHFWLGGEWTPAAPTMQKIFAICVIVWLLVVSAWQTYRAWRAPSG